MIVRLPPPILRTRALSSGRRPCRCLEFYGVGSQLVCSARSRTTLPIGSGVRETHSQKFDDYLTIETLAGRSIHMSELTGKVAIVTGASKGIGAAIAPPWALRWS